MTRPWPLLLRLLVPAALVAAAACWPSVSWSEAVVLLPLAYASLAAGDILTALLARRGAFLEYGAVLALGAALAWLWPALFWMFLLVAGPLGPVALLGIIAGTIAGRLVHGLRSDTDAPFEPAVVLPTVATTLIVRLLMDAAQPR